MSDWIYTTSENNKARFTLGQKGENIIACLGINPSTAYPGKLDSTVTSLKNIATSNDYDGWVMLNVYPQRATDPDNIHKRMNRELHQENLVCIKDCIERYDVKSMWLAYGDLVHHRKFLKPCLKELLEMLEEFDIKYYIVQDLTKKGNPRHPLYKKANSKLIPFNSARLML